MPSSPVISPRREWDAPERAVLAFLAPRLRPALARALPRRATEGWLEVRLRLGRPIELVTPVGDRWIGAGGDDPDLTCAPEDLERTLQLVTRASLYAWEEELARAFCTLPGGHRVGLCGRAVIRHGEVRAQKEFGSLAFRVARAVPGAADALAAHCGGPAGVRGVLVYGPPGSGKTTLLRDLARQLSAGCPARGVQPRRVVVVDERSELAACSAGWPQFDLGPRTDVLDACPKAQGLAMAVRALGPEVLVCDEVGGPLDAAAIADAARSGVAVMASAHAATMDDLLRRPGLRAVLRTASFALAARVTTARRLAEVIDLVAPIRARPFTGRSPASAWGGLPAPAGAG